MAYSNDLRMRAVNHYLNINKNYKEVSVLFQVGIATLYDWVQRFLANGSVESKRSSGRPPKVSQAEHEDLRKLVLSNADCSLSALAEIWYAKHGVEISIFAISRTMRRIGLSYKKNL